MGLMTVKDLGERWGLSESEVKGLIREDASIPFVRLGKRRGHEAQLEPSAFPA